jgi:hypothetical protein
LCGDQIFYPDEEEGDDDFYNNECDVVLVSDSYYDEIIVDNGYEGGDNESKKVSPERHAFVKFEVKTDPAVYQKIKPKLD